jgi:chemotaxis family two-component system response regulator Rcp1
MAQHRIVLVEDSEADVWVLRKCLESVATNHELIVLKDGEAALQFIEREREGLEPRPCVIVLDLHLPKRDGLELLRAIRRAPALEHVKAMIVSTTPSPETQRQIKDLGVTYAEKPNNIEGYNTLARQVWELCESTFGVAA